MALSFVLLACTIVPQTYGASLVERMATHCALEKIDISKERIPENLLEFIDEYVSKDIRSLFEMFHPEDAATVLGFPSYSEFSATKPWLGDQMKHLTERLCLQLTFKQSRIKSITIGPPVGYHPYPLMLKHEIRWESVFKLSELKEFRLYRMTVPGPVKWELLPPMVNILDFKHSRFSGGVDFGKCPKSLTVICFSDSRFAESRVNFDELANLNNLYGFFADHANLKGEINTKKLPRSIKSLRLHGNQLTGNFDFSELPSAIHFVAIRGNKMDYIHKEAAKPEWMLNDD